MPISDFFQMTADLNWKVQTIFSDQLDGNLSQGILPKRASSRCSVFLQEGIENKGA